jgi:hypothetical protein
MMLFDLPRIFGGASCVAALIEIGGGGSFIVGVDVALIVADWANGLWVERWRRV